LSLSPKLFILRS